LRALLEAHPEVRQRAAAFLASDPDAATCDALAADAAKGEHAAARPDETG
jgi:hypothetical protein